MSQTDEAKQKEFADLIFKVAETPMVQWIERYLKAPKLFSNVEPKAGVNYEIPDNKIVDIGIDVMDADTFSKEYKNELKDFPENQQLTHCKEFLSYALKVVHSSIMGSMTNQEHKDRLVSLNFNLTDDNYWNIEYFPLELRKLMYLKGVKETHDRNTEETQNKLKQQQKEQETFKKLQNLKEPCKIEIVEDSDKNDDDDPNYGKTEEENKGEPINQEPINQEPFNKEYKQLCDDINALEKTIKEKNYDEIIKEMNEILKKEPKFYITFKTIDKEKFYDGIRKSQVKKIQGASIFDT